MEENVIITPLSNIKDYKTLVEQITGISLTNVHLLYRASLIASEEINRCTEATRGLSGAMAYCFNKINFPLLQINPKAYMRLYGKKTLSLKEWMNFRKMYHPKKTMI